MGASVATVTDLAHLWIKVYLATDELPYVKLGQRAHYPTRFDFARCRLKGKS